jgi:hypothetical protein
MANELEINKTTLYQEILQKRKIQGKCVSDACMSVAYMFFLSKEQRKNKNEKQSNN